MFFFDNKFLEIKRERFRIIYFDINRGYEKKIFFAMKINNVKTKIMCI